MSLLFKFDFYEKLISEIKSAQAAGKFASSNAEKDWSSLLEKLLSAGVDFGLLDDDSD